MHQQEKFKRPEESLIVVISKGLSLYEASSLKLVDVLFLQMCRPQHKVTKHTKRQENITQSKKQNKSPETSPVEIEVYELSDEEFKIFITKILNKLRKMVHEKKKRWEYQQKERKIFKKNQTNLERKIYI